MKTPILKTERLILRPITLDDAPAVQKHFNNWEIIKYTSAPWPYPDDGAHQFLRDEILPKIAIEKHMGWAIILPEVKEYAGFIGRIDYRWQENEIDRGFWLAQNFQGQGYMTEAVVATQDYILLDLGITEFTVRNTISNKASHRIKEKTGADYVGLDDNNCCPYFDEPQEVWEITRENWAKIRGRD